MPNFGCGRHVGERKNMVCRNCGRNIPKGAEACAYCGLRHATEPLPDIRTYLAEAILVTIFCFMPFGIVAIVYAAQVSAFLRRGDVARAKNASKMARIWMNIGIWTGVGLLVVAVLILLMVKKLL